MTVATELPLPGDRVTVAAAQYAFGPSFLAGPGAVIENRDLLSRERGEILIHFDRGVTGRFGSTVLLGLLTSPSAHDPKDS